MKIKVSCAIYSADHTQGEGYYSIKLDKSARRRRLFIASLLEEMKKTLLCFGVSN